MREYMNEFTRYCKATFVNRNFWKIQWLNLMYVVKYTTKFRLIILTYSLSMSYLYVGLTNDQNELFTKAQSEAIVSTCVLLFIVARQLWLFVSLWRLFFPTATQLERAERWNSFFKQMLFVLLVASSKYLRTEMIFKNVSVEAIPDEWLFSGLSAVFCYLSMLFCIRQFWKKLGKQMLLSEITSKESLEIDVCSEKVYFVNGWNEFVRVLETGITYKYSRTGDLFYLPPSSYSKYGDTELQRTVAVALKYSMVTRTINRLTARVLAVKTP
ncbi:hypothetical protein [Enterococcus sp. 5H]|uniref:hypothetical protein n=1 Tax=Enterococcus sp. 5H TaxID=1229490 RepID=UPI00230288B4|nr:hypothetical protein [Enterococcus sp. 5H]MDA9469899.1 hypothetical protein [Enterococcus sp. 5H]